MPRLADLAVAIIERWQKQGVQSIDDVPGVLIDADTGGIDDGVYGDPLQDRRPDFVKEDNIGWQPLFKR